MKSQKENSQVSSRSWFVISLFLIFMFALLSRAVYLQLLSSKYSKKGDEAGIGIVNVSAHRGAIMDRNGEQLAISTPVDSIWTEPRKLLEEKNLQPLASLLNRSEQELSKFLRARIKRDFVFLKRHANPILVDEIKKLGIKGVSTQPEYKRYYPAAEVTAHVIGVTNVDDEGQEGIELAYNKILGGKSGKKRVLKDRLGRIVRDIENVKSSEPGTELKLSVDKRIQFLAYRELAIAVKNHQATSGTLVMLDVKTGEVIAMVGQPSFNPNNRSWLKNTARNRSVTDVFEPGSTMKVFTIAAGLESGIFTPRTVIDTSPGIFKVGNHSISDHHNFGSIDVTTVITKSSNVGATKIALALKPEYFYDVLNRFEFGQTTGSGFPGERSGLLRSFDTWTEHDMATLSFGYGVEVTSLKLAHVYSIIANDGIKLPVSFLKTDDSVQGERVISKKIARQIRDMLETVVSSQGTASKAGIKGYRVIGKTGTAHINDPRGGYFDDRYRSLFVGIVPASNPRFVTVVTIDEPNKDIGHFGGAVAAPVFAKVMEGTLRILNIPPDNLNNFNTPIIADTIEHKSFQGYK
ncbi:MAG: penicillin-binding transpeptidase domain-containing protein [Pseudomonadota bacterium]|nr:penicillin-binding transpeptidase domain-containing protein [Pseudomonadota bacterium]